METEFHDGDIKVIIPYLKQEHNDYVVVCNEEGDATFKQLKKYGKLRNACYKNRCNEIASGFRRGLSARV